MMQTTYALYWYIPMHVVGTVRLGYTTVVHTLYALPHQSMGSVPCHTQPPFLHKGGDAVTYNNCYTATAFA